MKVAFTNLWDPHWQAGQLLLESIFASLQTLETGRPSLALVVYPHTSADHYRVLQPYIDDVITLPDLRRPTPPPIHRRVRQWVKAVIRPTQRSARVPTLAELLGEHRVDCFFSAAFGTVQPTPTPYLAWVFDFQHHHLPHYFTLTERQERDRAFSEHAEAAALVLCTSEAVKNDFCEFAPRFAHKARVFKHTPFIQAAAYDDEFLNELSKYNLPERFFYLPNQFWAHKNHRVVLEALALLKQRAIRPYVVCTGSTVDHRHPGHFDSILKLLAESDLRDQVILLGVVPRPMVFALMRRAVCVLNPTLFEGLGMSLTEAIGLGKRLLVSDLPVLREQSAEAVEFFDPHQTAELADKMAAIWESAEAGPDRPAEAAARIRLLERQRESGQGWLRLCAEAISIQRQSA